jgi:hypothetical protein
MLQNGESKEISSANYAGLSTLIKVPIKATNVTYIFINYLFI